MIFFVCIEKFLIRKEFEIIFKECDSQKAKEPVDHEDKERGKSWNPL